MVNCPAKPYPKGQDSNALNKYNIKPTLFFSIESVQVFNSEQSSDIKCMGEPVL